MAKAPFRNMLPAARQRIAHIAHEMFDDGYPATAVCQRFNIPPVTLANICREYGIVIPRERRPRAN